MLSRGTIESYAAGVDSISDAAAGYVRGVLERAWAQGLEVAEMRELAIETLMAAADQYGGMTRELACTLYEEQTGQTAKVPAQSRVSREFVEDFARYNAGKLVDGDIGGFAKACADRASYFARRDVNETVISSCKKQKATGHRKRYRHGGGGKGTRFARVPQGGDTCTFCAMLASRGFVYWSEQTAGEFNHYHRNCRCLVVPDDGSREVEGYDPDEWHARWQAYEEIDARSDLTRGQKYARKILAGMPSKPKLDSSVGAARADAFSASSQVILDDHQFGKKAAKHCPDWGLDPSSEEDREVFKDIICGIIDNADAIDVGDWRGQESSPCTYYRRGEDLVIVDADSIFVTVMKGGASNKRYKGSIAAYRGAD